MDTNRKMISMEQIRLFTELLPLANHPEARIEFIVLIEQMKALEMEVDSEVLMSEIKSIKERYRINENGEVEPENLFEKAKKRPR